LRTFSAHARAGTAEERKRKKQKKKGGEKKKQCTLREINPVKYYSIRGLPDPPARLLHSTTASFFHFLRFISSRAKCCSSSSSCASARGCSEKKGQEERGEGGEKKKL